ncbi:MAG: sulfotransferase family 2 domain-containing protein [Methylotenera sp.]|uniref:sulfotransferase family 2 domain-containing protein n=1 Tax=Methylotenera sp. TaxID=2051956 RepID=UPI00272573C9|nr:sulfotransferase family 2 domain-containing protein [Methylotenera sp.]MDO9150510.1 sulfotransferase family 2 domain-containing protein [Methylotenera sp.]
MYIYKKISHLKSDSIRRINTTVCPLILNQRYKNVIINSDALKHVAIFPKLNIAFNRIKKNANSTSMVSLAYLDRGLMQNEKDAKRHSLHLQKMPLKEWLKMSGYHFSVVIRNPYTRVLSAFINKFSKSSYLEKYGPFEISANGFKKFLYWLQDGGLGADPHWDLQKKLMLLPLAYYDHVIKFENYAAEFIELLNKNSLDLSQEELKSLNIYSGPTIGSNSKLDFFYDDESRELVLKMYIDDFIWLGYTKEFPN